jgi:hypothetical protein
VDGRAVRGANVEDDDAGGGGESEGTLFASGSALFIVLAKD